LREINIFKEHNCLWISLLILTLFFTSRVLSIILKPLEFCLSDFNSIKWFIALFSNALDILKKIEKGEQDDYGSKRNDLSYSTTQLSAFIKYGLVSIREVACSILGIDGKKTDKITYGQMKNNALFRQLLWREFYAVILFYIPRVLKEPFQEKYKKLKWINNDKWTTAWKNGRTGFPIVDACMTQLNKSGYMHNRGRLIVSSFLVKILLTDWREGEHYFASMLVDYDPASNNGNWQWVAGTGTDSMPYFRIFNPWLQSEKYDKNASYIKKWLPHLKNVDAKHLHKWNEHWEDYDLKVLNYVKPIVDYKTQREKALKLYKSV
jgi:deoxyribodipyrimidine photo-lyase